MSAHPTISERTSNKRLKLLILIIFTAAILAAAGWFWLALQRDIAQQGNMKALQKALKTLSNEAKKPACSVPQLQKSRAELRAQADAIERNFPELSASAPTFTVRAQALRAVLAEPIDCENAADAALHIEQSCKACHQSFRETKAPLLQ